jgi:hypothetical protein
MEDKFEKVLQYWFEDTSVATPGYIALLKFNMTKYGRGKKNPWPERGKILNQLLHFMEDSDDTLTVMDKMFRKPTGPNSWLHSHMISFK